MGKSPSTEVIIWRENGLSLSRDLAKSRDQKVILLCEQDPLNGKSPSYQVRQAKAKRLNPSLLFSVKHMVCHNFTIKEALKKTFACVSNDSSLILVTPSCIKFFARTSHGRTFMTSNISFHSKATCCFKNVKKGCACYIFASLFFKSKGEYL